jgi:hypothetical protein
MDLAHLRTAGFCPDPRLCLTSLATPQASIGNSDTNTRLATCIAATKILAVRGPLSRMNLICLRRRAADAGHRIRSHRRNRVAAIRGPGGQGQSAAKDVPVEWNGEKNVRGR